MATKLVRTTSAGGGAPDSVWCEACGKYHQVLDHTQESTSGEAAASALMPAKKATTPARTVEAAGWAESIADAIRAVVLNPSLDAGARRKKVLDLLKLIDDVGGDDEAPGDDTEGADAGDPDVMKKLLDGGEPTFEALLDDGVKIVQPQLPPSLKGKRWKGGLTVGDLLARIRG